MGKKINHEIEPLKKKTKKKLTILWAHLYNISENEFLVLRKTMTEYLDKNFIRINNSQAANPVFSLKTPVEIYVFVLIIEIFNRITKKDIYFLPLIYDIFRNIGKTKWYTKLDVKTVIHKIKITEKNIWMIAFRTKYGLFKWIVIPYGLANAFNIFQKYIN